MLWCCTGVARRHRACVPRLGTVRACACARLSENPCGPRPWAGCTRTATLSRCLVIKATSAGVKICGFAGSSSSMSRRRTKKWPVPRSCLGCPPRPPHSYPSNALKAAIVLQAALASDECLFVRARRAR